VNGRRSGITSFDPTQPHIARIYDYLLDGKDNYAVDRAVGDRIIAPVPTAQIGVRAQRGPAGLELVQPGLVIVPDWRPDTDTLSAEEYPVLRLACAGVARPQALRSGGRAPAQPPAPARLREHLAVFQHDVAAADRESRPAVHLLTVVGRVTRP
jgi:hypothetical protein